MELLFVAGGLLLIYICMSELIVDVEIPLMNDLIQTPVGWLYTELFYAIINIPTLFSYFLSSIHF